LASEVAGLSAGVVLVWILAAHAIRRRDALRGAIALFAIVYLLLTISSRRFWSVGIPLLALAGAVCVASMADRRRAIVAGVVVARVLQSRCEPAFSSDPRRWSFGLGAQRACSMTLLRKIAA